jgi:hypothetical protein
MPATIFILEFNILLTVRLQFRLQNKKAREWALHVVFVVFY